MRSKPYGLSRMQDYLENGDAFNRATASLWTKDGLLPCPALRVETGKEGYELFLRASGQIQVFPVPECDFVTSYLVDYPRLWSLAAIDVRCAPSIWGSLPVFGVPFKRAVERALKHGHMKSKFFLPTNEGRHQETLLVQLDRTNDIRGSLLQLQVWEYSPGSDYARYIHALSSDFQTSVCHLDGAAIRFSEADLEVLLLKSRKVKGDSYKKYFRLDGAIEIEHMHNLARTFFRGQQLYDEAFEMEVLESFE